MAYLGDSLPCRFSADKNLLANVERGETQVRRQLRLNAGFFHIKMKKSCPAVRSLNHTDPAKGRNWKKREGIEKKGDERGKVRKEG